MGDANGLSWIQIAGIVVPLLVSAAGAIGGAFWRICKWAAPLIEKWVQAQIDCNTKVADAVAAQTPKLNEVHSMVSDLHAQATHAA